MGILSGLFGKKSSNKAIPICAACGNPITANPRHVGGAIIYEGTECSNCGKAYCLYCHNFSTLGPKCPGCGQWQLGPLLRAE